MTASSPPVVKISDPSDLLAVIPWLVGFRPAESLVVICLKGPRRRTGLTLRVDLPDPQDVRAMADDLSARVEDAGAAAVAVVCYSEAPDVDSALPHAELVERLLEECGRSGIGYMHVLLVRGGRWFSYDCREECCPPEGTPLREDASAVADRIGAEAALGGRTVLDSREELQRSVSGPTSVRLRAMEQVFDRIGDELVQERTASADAMCDRVLRLARARLEAFGEGKCETTDEDAATIALAMFDPELRDEICTWVLDGLESTLVAFLGDVARRTPDPLCPAVCTVLAWAAYARGDGALANVAVERALSADPGYRLALILLEGLTRQVRPSAIRAASRESRTELAARRKRRAAGIPEPRQGETGGTGGGGMQRALRAGQRKGAGTSGRGPARRRRR